jgi:hypothetical protein
MARFDRAIALSTKLIAKNGQAVTWRVIADGAPIDPAQPWKPTEQTAPVEHPVVIAFLPLSGDLRKTITRLRGTEVPINSTMGLLAAVDFNLTAKDVVIRDGQEWRIEYIDTLAPNGQKVLHTVVFKG